MFTRANVAKSITVPVCMILFVGITIMNVITGISAAVREDALTEEIIRAEVLQFAGILESQGDAAYTFATTAAPLVEEMRHDANGRRQVISAFEKIVEENHGILSIWSVWEPDAFDGKDRQYANTPGHDETGRFVPWVYRRNGEVLTEPLLYYDDEEYGVYYQQAKGARKAQYIGPYEYKTSNKNYWLYSVTMPVFEDEKVVGAVGVDIDMEEMNSWMSAVEFLDTGYLLTINPQGIIVTTRNSERLNKHYMGEKGETSYAEDIGRIITQGGTAVATDRSSVLGKKTSLYFQGVRLPDDDGYWAVCGVVPDRTVHAQVARISTVNSIVGIVTLVVIGASMSLIVRRRLRGLSQMTDAALKMAEGRVDDILLEEAGDFSTENEVELLHRAFGKMIDASRERVLVLERIAEGDMTPQVHPRSDEDVMGMAMQQMLLNNNHMLHEIQMSADVVNEGAEQIANGSQYLAAGTLEHSASVEELCASVEEVASAARDNQGLADGASELNEKIKKIASRAADKMQVLDNVVKEVNRASGDIGGVMRVIDDIAFQTNILALNAAVEAARAGQQGRGFAVVADEVRNLAGKSAEAAKNSDALITGTIAKAEQGAQATQEVVEILGEMMDNIQEHSELIEKIPPLIRDQVAAIDNISAGIQQVSESTQNTSTMAEESAATSEELRSQANMLHQLASQYRLVEEKDERRRAHGGVSGGRPTYGSSGAGGPDSAPAQIAVSAGGAIQVQPGETRDEPAPQPSTGMGIDLGTPGRTQLPTSSFSENAGDKY